MASVEDQRQQSGATAPEDESPVAILRHLEEERGRMFSETEYREMRKAVLEELAHGARFRPFTVFTFAVVGLGLLAMIFIGLATSAGRTAGDYALAIISTCALIATGYFFWSCLRGIKLDALRSLDTRLAEVEQLREARLITTEEYQNIHAHILIARQRHA